MEDASHGGADDAVDLMIAQWRVARPDLDPWPHGIVGRVHRLNRIVEREMGRYYAEYGLDGPEFDVLAALRAAGREGSLTAGELLRASTVTSGAVTNRIDKLERKGLVERAPDPVDRRSVVVSLTGPGRALVDDMLEGYFEAERRVIAALPDPDGFARSLRTLLISLGDAAPPGPPGGL
ncbi:MarR family transcriptional regulator [Actinocorallia sp. A-T 12471]|uniref:MarR family winged helix-turn-helix transcriptional regulator n=1 Tax=Actinocorallia sp. A-T 12471 TaxID=3089813 RepID=UPI0029D2E5C7|nr:MarR family transcriptional regulator [Actinocorallia sp. A-T 12471]MDX6742088.1 MarR family transcriptional regulator [Actinocorallia sp. A-T 12471]